MRAEELMGSQIFVKGRLNRVTYKSPDFESGDYAIFKLDCTEIDGDIPEEFMDVQHNYGKLLTFTGSAPSLNGRIEYEILGELTHNERYGYQYKILRMSEGVSFENNEDIEKFFSYILPEKTARKIMETLEDPIDVLDRGDIAALTRIKGVGAYYAAKILERYKEAKIDSKAYIQLYEYGLTKTTIQKICASYGSPEVAVKKILANPYILIYDVRGIGWNKADDIALRGGVSRSDPKRVKAFVYYVLRNDGEKSGNTRADLDELIEVVEETLAIVPRKDILSAVAELIQEGRLYFNKNSRFIGLMENRIIEEKIAKELERISKAETIKVRNVDGVIKKCEDDEGFSYSEEQIFAIYDCIKSNISIVTGFPGAGKTSVMYPVSQIMATNHYRVALCALSGKASVNLEEATRLHGSTIHRLLGYRETGEFEYNKTNPLDYNMIILDEASMVDEYIFLRLLEAIPNGCKLVMLGDIGQLEPIGIGCVFNDIIKSHVFPHTNFTKIFRQAQKSGIITQSRRVYHEEYIVGAHDFITEIRGELKDFKVITRENINECISEAILEYKRFMEEYHATIDDIIIVTGKRSVGETSARVINNYIQKMVNGRRNSQEIKFTKKDSGTSVEILFRPGDKVLVTKNCYDTHDLEGNLCPVFNGNLGTIISIERQGMKILFRQGTIWYPSEKYIELELGYAITCHKCQGSGIPYVITLCDTSSYVLLSKEWLYTAITRAKKYHTLIGQPSAIRRACSTTGVKYKQTWLKDLILDAMGKV